MILSVNLKKFKIRLIDCESKSCRFESWFYLGAINSTGVCRVYVLFRARFSFDIRTSYFHFVIIIIIVLAIRHCVRSVLKKTKEQKVKNSPEQKHGSSIIRQIKTDVTRMKTTLSLLLRSIPTAMHPIPLTTALCIALQRVY